MKMELQESLVILKLKSRFFDILDTANGLQYGNLLDEMLLTIQKLISAKDVTLFGYDEWKQQFFIEASTNKGHKVDTFVSKLSIDEFEEQLKGRTIYRNPSNLLDLEESDILIPLRKDHELIGCLSVKVESDNGFLCILDCIFEQLMKQCTLFLDKAKSLEKIVIEEKRYKQLFRVTEKFHSSMNMDDVLGEIIYTLREVYPTFVYYLLLSHDNHQHSDLPIKDLEYDSENIAAMQAYVTGTIQIEDSIQELRSILYAPLKGKQGVYGVLQVIAPNTLIFPENEVEFITLLANTAGGALENAQLYHQSRRLISDLQLINETSHRLNSNLRLTETIKYMSDQIIESFDAGEVGFILFGHDQENVRVLSGSTDFFSTGEAQSYIRLLKGKIDKDKESLFIGDLSLQNNGESQFRSVMAVPMVQDSNLKGMAIVMHQEPYHFAFETFKLLQSLIHHSTLAFTNSMLREELEKMVVTDHLTKLYSRSYLDENLQMSLLEDQQGTFVLIDIDNFKRVNDTYGHQVGDSVLIQVANVIFNNIRSSDIGARWGGEELAIYLPKVPLDIGISIAERLVNKVGEETDPHVTISCGVSYWSTDSQDTAQNIFKRADEALYIAKATGKNKVVVHEDHKGLAV